jgi:hypothetical protein
MRWCIFLFTLFSTLLLKSQSDVSSSLWFSTTPVIDGTNTEWKRPFGLYDGTTGVMFALANDSHNLYVCLTLSEEWQARKILRAGFEVEVSCKEKNRKISGLVKVPGYKPEEPEKEIRGYGWGPRPDFSPFVNAYRLNFTTIEAQRFLNGNGVQAFNNPAGVQVNMAADSVQGLVIEMAIPLQMLFDKALVTLNEQVQLQVMVNGIAMPIVNNTANPDASTGWDNSTNRGSSALGNQTGFNDITGQNIGGGNGTFNSQSTQAPPTTRSPLSEQTSFKQKFKLVGR